MADGDYKWERRFSPAISFTEKADQVARVPPKHADLMTAQHSKV